MAQRGIGSKLLDLSPRALTRYLKTDLGRKTFRYAAVSAVAVVVNQAVLSFCFGVLHWSAATANVIAVAISTVPSYYLNRMWVWGKNGKSHLWREIVPFWVLAFIGLVFSTWAADFGESVAKSHDLSHLGQTLTVNAFSLGSYAVTWVGKFVLFHKVLFVHRHHHDKEPHVQPVG